MLCSAFPFLDLGDGHVNQGCVLCCSAASCKKWCWYFNSRLFQRWNPKSVEIIQLTIILIIQCCPSIALYFEIGSWLLYLKVVCSDWNFNILGLSFDLSLWSACVRPGEGGSSVFRLTNIAGEHWKITGFQSEGLYLCCASWFLTSLWGLRVKPFLYAIKKQSTGSHSLFPSTGLFSDCAFHKYEDMYPSETPLIYTLLEYCSVLTVLICLTATGKDEILFSHLHCLKWNDNSKTNSNIQALSFEQLGVFLIKHCSKYWKCV